MRKPVDDVERVLAVVDAGDVHAEFSVVGTKLRREHRGLARDKNAALAEFHRDRLSAAGGNNC